MTALPAEETPRMPGLDGLRGIAILMVIYHHYIFDRVKLVTGSTLELLLRPGRIGWTGVDLFFVLSGFLVGGILIRNRESPSYYRTFYVRRACRILPPYLALVLALYLVQPGYFSGRSGAPLWQFLTFTQNFWMAAMGTFGILGITWSLAIEEQFYLTAPLLIRAVKPERLGRALMACIVLAPIFRMLMYGWLPPKEAYFAGYVLTITRMDSLAIGVLAGWLHHRGVRYPMRWLYAACLVLGAGMMWIAWSFPGTWSHFFYFDYFALFYVCVILVVVQGGFRFLRWKPLASIGLVSYSLYLLHPTVYRFLERLPYFRAWPRAAFTAMVMAVLFALAAFSWRFLEKPFIRLGHRFGYRASENGAAPDALSPK